MSKSVETTFSLFNLPMTDKVSALEATFMMFKLGSAATALLLTDEEVVESMVLCGEVVESEYAELRDKVDKEMNIKMPSVEKCASVGEWLGQIASACFAAVLDGFVDLCTAVGKAAGGLLGGLFSGMGFGGMLLLGGIAVACIVIFL